MRPIALSLLLGLTMLDGVASAQEPAASGGKIAGTAIVVLTREFCTAEANTGNRTSGFEVFRLGRLLCPSAEQAVRNAFERVIRMETVPKPEDAGGHLILIPRFTDVEATHTIVKNRKMALLLDWSATEPGGRVLWVQTVEGTAVGKNGAHQSLAEAVAQDLVANSTEAMKKSQEIRHFIEDRLGK